MSGGEFVVVIDAGELVPACHPIFLFLTTVRFTDVGRIYRRIGYILYGGMIA